MLIFAVEIDCFVAAEFAWDFVAGTFGGGKVAMSATIILFIQENTSK
jgi:hypothetical protein